jgi:hypothetical protein
MPISQLLLMFADIVQTGDANENFNALPEWHDQDAV